MATIQERFSMIEASIMHTVTEKAEALKEKEDTFRATALKNAEEEILREMYSRIQDEVSEIKIKSTRNVAQQETKERHDLLLRREDITTAVFDKVRLSLKAFTKTSEYKQHILTLAKDMAEKYPLEDAVIMVKREDYAMSIELNKIFHEKCRIVADADIRIGGIRLMNQSSGIFVDESLDHRLEEQKPWFYSHSGLKVT